MNTVCQTRIDRQRQDRSTLGLVDFDLWASDYGMTGMSLLMRVADVSQNQKKVRFRR